MENYIIAHIGFSGTFNSLRSKHHRPYIINKKDTAAFSFILMRAEKK